MKFISQFLRPIPMVSEEGSAHELEVSMHGYTFPVRDRNGSGLLHTFNMLTLPHDTWHVPSMFPHGQAVMKRLPASVKTGLRDRAKFAELSATYCDVRTVFYITKDYYRQVYAYEKFLRLHTKRADYVVVVDSQNLKSYHGQFSGPYGDAVAFYDSELRNRRVEKVGAIVTVKGGWVVVTHDARLASRLEFLRQRFEGYPTIHNAVEQLIRYRNALEAEANS